MRERQRRVNLCVLPVALPPVFKERLGQIPMCISPRREGLADSRRAIAQADVAVFPDGVRELDKAPMLLCGDEGSYLATVVLHGLIAFEIGAQLGLSGRLIWRGRRLRHGQKICHARDTLADLRAQRAAIGRARRLNVFERHGALGVLGTDRAT